MLWPHMFYIAGCSLVPVALAGRALKRVPEYQCDGLLTLAQVLVFVGSFLGENTVAACVSAAGAAYLGWQWWNGGGDDDTKRRRRAIARRFQGVRRTAPAGG